MKFLILYVGIAFIYIPMRFSFKHGIDSSRIVLTYVYVICGAINHTTRPIPGHDLEHPMPLTLHWSMGHWLMIVRDVASRPKNADSNYPSLFTDFHLKISCGFMKEFWLQVVIKYIPASQVIQNIHKQLIPSVITLLDNIPGNNCELNVCPDQGKYFQLPNL